MGYLGLELKINSTLCLGSKPSLQFVSILHIPFKSKFAHFGSFVCFLWNVVWFSKYYSV